MKGSRMYKYTIDDEINELKRELKLREKVYPAMIGDRKMKRLDARKYYMIMKQTLMRLEAIKKEQQGEQATIKYE